MSAASTFAMLGLNNLGATIIGIGVFAGACFIPHRVLPYWRSLMTDELPFAFCGKHQRRIFVMVILSFILVGWIAWRMTTLGIGLTGGGELGDAAVLVSTVFYGMVVVALNISCYLQVSDANADHAESAENDETFDFLESL